ncbi:hypothetical protein QZH41_014797 [Actinostola sp. cb2023]|nr:hypothetical protein QZH41_014797 [Actinostola sp. cb2023]
MFKTPTKTFKCSFLIILVVLENAFSSFLPYEFENDGDVESVVFTAEDNGKDSLGQLHLQGSSPQIIFQLRRRDNDTNYNRNVLVSRYVSRGMHPTIMFWNTSWSISFELNELVQAESDVYWKRNITVSELFHPQTQHNSFKRWNFIAELGKGLNLFQKKGSLIIGDAEPLLNLQFGDLMESNAISLQSLPNDVILRSSPCSSVVAGVVPLTNMSENPNSGCYFGVTHNYFSTSSIKWYNLLHLSSGTPDNHSLCKQSSFSKCSSLSVLDFALLRSHLLFVTTHGIMVSQSFEDAIRSGFGSKISFAKVNSVHPIIDKAATLGSLQRSDIQLFYTPHCYNNFVSDSKEEVCIVYNNGTTIVLCSSPPYDKWEQHGFEDIPSGYVVVSLVLDIQRKTKVTLVKNISKGNSVVQVYKGSSRSFPTFKFGNHETITGLYFHLYTSAIYAYGSQLIRYFENIELTKSA